MGKETTELWCNQKKTPKKSLCLSEIITILIAFHQNHYRNFKHFYLNQVKGDWHSAFPSIPSYQRFIEWVPSTLVPLCVYLKHCFGSCTGISFIDSTCLKVCHNRRIKRHEVFDGLADRGKTSVDWFYGFKLHLVVNELSKATQSLALWPFATSLGSDHFWWLHRPLLHKDGSHRRYVYLYQSTAMLSD